jgi:hypothetical protein
VLEWPDQIAFMYPASTQLPIAGVKRVAIYVRDMLYVSV